MTTTTTVQLLESLCSIGQRLDRHTVALASHGAPAEQWEAMKALSDDVWRAHHTVLDQQRAAQQAAEQAARVRVRMDAVWQHIEAMRAERQGWGSDADAAIGRTALSWARARNMLDAAPEVWLDGGSGLCFGGRTAWNTTFGCIARTVRDTAEAQPLGGWAHPEIEWTFHE